MRSKRSHYSRVATALRSSAPQFVKDWRKLQDFRRRLRRFCFFFCGRPPPRRRRSARSGISRSRNRIKSSMDDTHSRCAIRIIRYQPKIVVTTSHRCTAFLSPFGSCTLQGRAHSSREAAERPAAAPADGEETRAACEAKRIIVFVPPQRGVVIAGAVAYKTALTSRAVFSVKESPPNHKKYVVAHLTHRHVRAGQQRGRYRV